MRTAVLTVALGVSLTMPVRSQGGATAAQLESVTQAFFKAFTSGDVAAMKGHFADTVVFVGDLRFLGEQIQRGQREVTRDALTVAYTSLISRMGREKWIGIGSQMKPALTRATADAGPPEDASGSLPKTFVKAGEYLYELRLGPGLHNMVLFVLRPVDGKWKIVAHWADY